MIVICVIGLHDRLLVRPMIVDCVWFAACVSQCECVDLSPSRKPASRVVSKSGSATLERGAKDDTEVHETSGPKADKKRPSTAGASRHEDSD